MKAVIGVAYGVGVGCAKGRKGQFSKARSGGRKLLVSEQRGGVGLAFGRCCGVGENTRIRIDGAWCVHTGMAGKPGGGVASKAKGAIGSVTCAQQARAADSFGGFLPGREIFSGKSVECRKNWCVFFRGRHWFRVSADWPRLLADVAAVENKRSLQRHVEVLELALHEHVVLVVGDMIARENKSKGSAVAIECEWR